MADGGVARGRAHIAVSTKFATWYICMEVVLDLRIGREVTGENGNLLMRANWTFPALVGGGLEVAQLIGVVELDDNFTVEVDDIFELVTKVLKELDNFILDICVLDWDVLVCFVFDGCVLVDLEIEIPESVDLKLLEEELEEDGRWELVMLKTLVEEERMVATLVDLRLLEKGEIWEFEILKAFVDVDTVFEVDWEDMETVLVTS